MTTPIDNQIEGYFVSSRQEIKRFKFDKQQANLLHKFSESIAAMGGPQARGARIRVALAATELRFSFSLKQHTLIQAYANGLIPLLAFEGLQKITDTPPPKELPPLSTLEDQYDILCLAARSQILLKLVEQLAFAYDIDNDGKLVRLVANFKGGGVEKIYAEPDKIELSSHSGLALGPHTEAPYWCALKAENGHSPSPSSLILTALWNPSMEATSVIPLHPILEKLGIMNALALTARRFNFTRSDSFMTGKGEDGRNVSILEFNDNIGFSVRSNAYRFSVDENASLFVKKAFKKFCRAIEESTPQQYCVTQESALLIDNNHALHCRDIVKDNRRLLVRLFGLSKFSEALIISEDPLLLRG